MDFEIPEKIRTMVDRVAHFVKEELEPISQKVDAEDEIPEQIVQKMRDLGLFGLALPKQYGGLGLNMLGTCMVYEELSKTNACFRTRIASNNGIGSQGTVIDGTEKQKSKYLPKLATGEWTAAFAITEPDAGSDVANIRTKAQWEKDHWCINGLKHFITNAIEADIVTVFAVTDPENRARGGITSFIVEKDFPGMTVGTVEKMVGLRGIHTCELVFKDCRVPPENVIGGEQMVGKGFRTAMQTLDKGRIAMGASSVGAAQKLLEISVDFAKQEVQSGRPLAESQAIQFMLADVATQIYAGRQMVYNGAWLRDSTGRSVIKEASMIKLFCTEMANRVADAAMQIFGIKGRIKGMPVERFFRDLRVTRIYEGTSEIQRLVIARELLRD